MISLEPWDSLRKAQKNKAIGQMPMAFLRTNVLTAGQSAEPNQLLTLGTGAVRMS